MEERLSLEEVQSTLSSNKLDEKFGIKAYGAGDGLVTRGRSSIIDNKGGRKRSRMRIVRNT